MINGRPQTKYVLSTDWSKGNIRVNGGTITLHGGGHAYLGDSSSNDLSPNAYYHMPLFDNQQGGKNKGYLLKSI